MARSAAVSVENNFSKGLITEASGLNFPENACTETFNCIFNEKGLVTRRLGFDYEDNNELVPTETSLTNQAISTTVWDNVDGQGDLIFVGVQFGDQLYIFRNTETGSLSGDLVRTINLNNYLVAGAPDPAGQKCNFASGNGALFVTHPYLETFYIEYDIDTELFTETTVNVEIRDFETLEDNLDNDERPTTLTTNHKYNLYNHGWYVSTLMATNGPTSNDATGPATALSHWDSRRSDFPSNADVWWTFKFGNYDYFDMGRVDQYLRGNSLAPAGHYILNPFYQDRTDASGIAGLAVESSGYSRPSACAFHSGRLFLAGVASGDYSNKVYFSQIVESPKQYGKCYQANDPTSEDLSDLLPTDGGVIHILGAGTIVKLISLQNALVAVCTNGIWSISGSQGLGFAANDYSVAKISDIGSPSANSFIMVQGFPFWWNPDGIYALTPDPVSQSLQVKPLTDQTIKTFYDDIPVSSKAYAMGAYNSRTRVLIWLYRSTEGDDLSEYQQFDRAVALNTITGAFYPWEISQLSQTDGPFISGVFSTAGLATTSETANVVDGSGNQVIDGMSQNVTATISSTQFETSSFRYLTVIKDAGTFNITFSQEGNINYEDWASLDATDYDSYLMSGYKVHGNAVNKFQSNYLTVYLNQEDNASCWLQAWWDYANTEDTGRVTIPQQCFKDNEDFDLSVKRLKIRGQGKALQFKLYSEAGKPFTIVGWGSFETGNTQP